MGPYWLVWPAGAPPDHLAEGRVVVEGRLGRYTVDEVVHWILEGDTFRSKGGDGRDARVLVCRCPASARPHLLLEP